jgi:hypothetical protein
MSRYPASNPLARWSSGEAKATAAAASPVHGETGVVGREQPCYAHPVGMSRKAAMDKGHCGNTAKAMEADACAIGNRLPLHVRRIVSTPEFEVLDVVDQLAWA